MENKQSYSQRIIGWNCGSFDYSDKVLVSWQSFRMQIFILNVFLFIWICFLLYSFTTWIKFNSFSLPVLGNCLFNFCTYCRGCMRWRSWWRHCATRQKVAGSIPDGVMPISHHTMTMRSTQPLTKKYQGYFQGGEGGRWWRLTNLPHSWANCLESLGVSTSCSPHSLSRPV